jgi:hypothetical protein
MDDFLDIEIPRRWPSYHETGETVNIGILLRGNSIQTLPPGEFGDILLGRIVPVSWYPSQEKSVCRLVVRSIEEWTSVGGRW